MEKLLVVGQHDDEWHIKNILEVSIHQFSSDASTRGHLNLERTS